MSKCLKSRLEKLESKVYEPFTPVDLKDESDFIRSIWRFATEIRDYKDKYKKLSKS